MLSGAMPKRRRYFHRMVCGFLCLFFAGFTFPSAYSLLRAAAIERRQEILIAGLLFPTIPALFIGMQLWFRRRTISEFAFDGRAFQFQTLGRSRRQTRELSEIAQVRDWRGRGGQLGYRLVFRNGAKAYLEYSVSNSTTVAEQLRLHIARI
jgi:hypothetical protein